MRFVFPQLSGLRPSAMAQCYARASDAEVITALLRSHAPYLCGMFDGFKLQMIELPVQHGANRQPVTLQSRS